MPKVIKTLLNQMSHICEENNLKLNEIREVFIQKSGSPSGLLEVNSHSIDRRQVFTAISAGLVTILLSSFTTHQLLTLSQHNEEQETL